MYLDVTHTSIVAVNKQCIVTWYNDGLQRRYPSAPIGAPNSEGDKEGEKCDGGSNIENCGGCCSRGFREDLGTKKSTQRREYRV